MILNYKPPAYLDWIEFGCCTIAVHFAVLLKLSVGKVIRNEQFHIV